jgi:hypothetical protein
MKTQIKLFQSQIFCAAALVLGILDHTTAQAQLGGVPLWTNRYHCPEGGDGQALPSSLASDRSGNVLVTGSSTGRGGDFDYATIKYSSAGLALWTNRYDGPGNTNDSAFALAIDSSGNVLVTGESTGSGGDSDYATIKYSGAGTPLWTNRYDGPGNTNDYASALAVDSSGNVLVTGPSTGRGGDFDYATIKYSSAGFALWTNRYNRPGKSYYYLPGFMTDDARALAVDSSGNVFVTGFSFFRSANLTDSEYATIKYSGGGVPLWTNNYGAPEGFGGSDSAAAVALDCSGHVFVTGTADLSGGDYDYATIAYSEAGVPLWTNRYDGRNGPDGASAMTVDSSGNVFVTGASSGTNGAGRYDFATIKYSSAIPPSLAISHTTTNTMAVSWPSPTTGFTLQQSANGFAALNWSNVLATPSDDGTTRTVIVNPPTGNQFYRLFHP